MRRSLAIAAATALVLMAPAVVQAATAPPAVQKAFNGFIKKFRAAVKADDHVAVAGMTRLPFQGDASIATAEQFYTKVYQPDFTKKNRACIGKAKPVYDRDGEGTDSFFVFCGELIFVFGKTSSGFLFTDISVND